ncbi:MAG: sulfotransferase domain-containing protein [Planctomycetota bacterium]
MSLVAFYSHHKCASTWISGTLRAACDEMGWKLAYLPQTRDFGGDLAGYVERNKIDLVSYVNAEIEHARTLPEHRGFHVVRDPRDVIVSGYFSHKKTHPTHAWPELIPHREKLQKLSKRDGLLEEIEFSSQFLDPMSSWDYDQPHVLELRQEEFTSDPYRGFLEVFEFLGLLDDSHYNKVRWPGYLLSSSLNILHMKSAVVPRKKRKTIPGERVLGIVYDRRFEKFAGGRSKGQVDEKSHYRRGKAGDWREHLEDVHIDAFRARYGDLVERLGYAW